MAKIKISELSPFETLLGTDEVPFARGGTTGRGNLNALVQLVGTSLRWRVVSSASYLTSPASTSRILMTNTTGFLVGLPVRYRQAGVFRYGIVEAVSSNAHIDITGAGLNALSPIQQLDVGTPEMIASMELFIPGQYGNALQVDAIRTQIGVYPFWPLSDAYLVGMRATHRIKHTTTQPKINAYVDSLRIFTPDATRGIQLGNSGVLVSTTGVVSDLTRYRVTKDTPIDIEITGAGVGGTKAEDLSLSLLFVLE